MNMPSVASSHFAWKLSGLVAVPGCSAQGAGSYMQEIAEGADWTSLEVRWMITEVYSLASSHMVRMPCQYIASTRSDDGGQNISPYSASFLFAWIFFLAQSNIQRWIHYCNLPIYYFSILLFHSHLIFLLV